MAGEVLQPEGSRDAELVKLRAERDALVDRLARSQAEFDNARKRAVPDVTVTVTPPAGVPIQPYGPPRPLTDDCRAR